MKINVLWTSLVSDSEVKAILSGVRQFANALSIPKELIKVYGSSSFVKNGKVNSANSILANASRVGRLIESTDINRELMREFKNEIVVFATTRNIAGDGKFVLGYTTAPCSTINVSQFRRLDPLWRHWAIVSIVMHELGHTHGMACPDPKNKRKTIRYSYGYHCANPGCIMRQSYGVNEFVNHAKDAVDKGRFFCPDCINEAITANRRKGWYQNPR